MGAPEIKAAAVTYALYPLSYHRVAVTGIRTRNLVLQREVSAACAPGAPDASPPEIKVDCGVLSDALPVELQGPKAPGGLEPPTRGLAMKEPPSSHREVRMKF